jgi:hypothetical protein
MAPQGFDPAGFVDIINGWINEVDASSDSTRQTGWRCQPSSREYS